MLMSPTSDTRELALTRYTQTAPDLNLLLDRLQLFLPAQPPRKITAAQLAAAMTEAFFRPAKYRPQSLAKGFTHSAE